MAKQYYFLKLNPPRPSFAQDMNNEEREIMLKHVEYWKPYVKNGTVLVLGPVMDPKGFFGIAVAGVEAEADLMELISKDPANGLNVYEIYPMRAVSNMIG